MTWEQVKVIRTRLSRESGTIIKDWGGKLPVALIYPNSYHIGMSNLGVHAIYRFINERTDSLCERVFYDDSENEPLAMESQRPISDFAVFAFSVSYELDYFNVVRILKSAGIPLYAKDRNEEHPLVIAGGPCITSNPMPLAPFFDCLCIGEAEAILPAMLPVMQKGTGEDREALLKTLAEVPGVYVPQFTAKSVTRQWLKDLDSSPVHSAVLTRDTELGDMYLIEVQRGCRFGCRFCLVSCAFKPMRVHSVDNIIGQAREGLKHRKCLGLVGPAVTDHPQIEEITTRLRAMGAALSVSSLRIKPLPATLLGAIIKGGSETIALAPEAGSQRLRDYIRKGIDEDDILKAVETVAMQKVRRLKLYFMIGLPTETDEDIEEMAWLVMQCKTMLEKHINGSRITMTIAPFVPKAGTAFERLGMERLEVINRRLQVLKNSLKQKGISVKNESVEWSEVQAVLSRGDEKVGLALAGVEKVTLAEWHRVMEKNGLDIDFYAHETWDASRELGWEIIDTQ